MLGCQFYSFYLIVILDAQYKYYFEQYALYCSLPHTFVVVQEDDTLYFTEILMSQVHAPQMVLSKRISVSVGVSFLNMSASKYQVFVIIVISKNDTISFFTSELKFKVVVYIHFCISQEVILVLLKLLKCHQRIYYKYST